MTTHADLEAERAVIAAGLRTAQAHHTTRQHLTTARQGDMNQFGDYWYRQHAQIHDTLDHLADIGPFLVDHAAVDWAALWPYTLPSSVRVRCAAVWTLCDELGGDVRVLHRIAEQAATHLERALQRVAACRGVRDEIDHLERRIAELTA